MFRTPAADHLTLSLAPPMSEGQQFSELAVADRTLDDLCSDIADAVAAPMAHRARRVNAALLPYLGLPDLLPQHAHQSAPDRYARHLLHAAADFTILALVWRPGQMSPIHSHRTWCAFGVHQGWLVETAFAPGLAGVVVRDCAPLRACESRHSSEDQEAAHRLANLGSETTVSIHIYGAPYDRLGEQINQIWAE